MARTNLPRGLQRLGESAGVCSREAGQGSTPPLPDTGSIAGARSDRDLRSVSARMRRPAPDATAPQTNHAYSMQSVFQSNRTLADAVAHGTLDRRVSPPRLRGGVRGVKRQGKGPPERRDHAGPDLRGSEQEPQGDPGRRGKPPHDDTPEPTSSHAAPDPRPAGCYAVNRTRRLPGSGPPLWVERKAGLRSGPPLSGRA